MRKILRAVLAFGPGSFLPKFYASAQCAGARRGAPTRVSTYAFVNPVVALLLGWAAVGEIFGPRTLLAAALILPSLVILIGGKEERRARKPRGGKIREGLDSSVELT
ncbi:MAG: hypothetical protein IT572_08405 [Deltaproteobacteria bacterium]|nr:hypothetical protein [Deltaproteobacteria bacterium]